MRNAAKAGVFFVLIAIVVGVALIGSNVEAVPAEAKDSAGSVRFKDNFDKKDILSFDVNVEAESVSSSGSKYRSFRATAYCLRGKTASGRYVRRGIVAADPRVLRLGTRIHMTAGRYTGNYLVADTGGKIKGRILDIWVPSCSEARRWGRRTVKVKVLSSGKYKKKRRR